MIDVRRKLVKNIAGASYRELFEKLQILNGVSGPEREELRNQLADWIAETYPLRVRKPTKRKFAESEKNALDVVFGGI